MTTATQIAMESASEWFEAGSGTRHISRPRPKRKRRSPGASLRLGFRGRNNARSCDNAWKWRHTTD